MGAVTARARYGICFGIALAVLPVPPALAADDAENAASATRSRSCVIDTTNFPTYPAIEPNVEFWKRVYGEWGQNQVVVHDLEYPALVYEVVTLPGDARDRYTEEQQRFVDALIETWRARLRDLAARTDSAQPLDDHDKELALELATQAGSTSLPGACDRVRTQRGLRERFRRGLEIGGRYDGAVRGVLAGVGLPEDLAYLPHVESSYQSAARSSAGAVGAWQFTRGTGRSFLRIDGTLDERLDPILAARGAAAYLKAAHDRLGNWALALTSYNHGLNGMVRAAGAHGSDYEAVFRDYRGQLFGFASRNFYAEFLAARAVACDAGRYFPEGLSIEAPAAVAEVVLAQRTTPSRMASAWGIEVARLTEINPAWSSRTVRENRALPAGSTVWVPADMLARISSAPGGVAAAWEGKTQPAGGPDVHVVRSGESLSQVARGHGLSVAELRALNGLAPGADLIQVGQKLRVAPEEKDSVLDRLIHVVRRGDTLMRIAMRYGVKLADLLAHNGLSADSPIYPGQIIRIP